MKRARRTARAPLRPPLVVEDGAEARLTAIAADHIRRFGLDRVRLVGVAREAGMSHANVYRFFPSKAGLIEAVVVAWMRSVEMTLADIAAAPDPADDKLERFLVAWARAQRDSFDRDAPIYQAYAQFFAEKRASVTAHRARTRTLLAAILDEGLEPGPFRVKDEERALAFVSDAMQRFVHPLLVIETRDLTRSQTEARLSAMLRVVIRTLISGGL